MSQDERASGSARRAEPDGGSTPEDEPRRPGRRVVTLLYVAIVALTGFLGYVVGAIRSDRLDPQLFGVIDLPGTAFGMAVYGVVTVGVLLGVLLLAVSYVSRWTGAADE